MNNGKNYDCAICLDFFYLTKSKIPHNFSRLYVTENYRSSEDIQWKRKLDIVLTYYITINPPPQTNIELYTHTCTNRHIYNNLKYQMYTRV